MDIIPPTKEQLIRCLNIIDLAVFLDENIYNDILLKINNLMENGK